MQNKRLQNELGRDCNMMACSGSKAHNQTLRGLREQRCTISRISAKRYQGRSRTSKPIACLLHTLMAGRHVSSPALQQLMMTHHTRSWTQKHHSSPQTTSAVFAAARLWQPALCCSLKRSKGRERQENECMPTTHHWGFSWAFFI